MMIAQSLDLESLRIETRDCQAPVHDLASELCLPDFLARAFRCRGVDAAEDLNLSLSRLETPDSLPDINRASERLLKAISADEHIAVAGDFDADGATATALCVSFLKRAGCTRISYHVPDRVRFGYGLGIAFCEQVLQSEPSVLVTVDNGVSSIDGVALAQASGTDVIVTDHHLPPEVLPNAHSIVNPALEGSRFKGKLAGVGVAFYLMWVVLRLLERSGHFGKRSIPEIQITEWLDLVAVGTIADLVPLDHNNRILVRQGLNRMRSGKVSPGIRALCAVAKRNLRTLSVRDLGFAIGPRLNAAGRISTMVTGIQCLLAEDSKQAKKLASTLNKINQARRTVQADMTRTADELLAKSEVSAPALCLYHPSFNEGVVGLVAGRVKDLTGKPTAVFANSHPASAGQIKGSVRSISGINIRDILAEIDSRYPHLIQKFGGHAMAAGLTIRNSSLPRFRKIFETSVHRQLECAPPPGTVETDGGLDASLLTEESARLIERFAPWGKDFEEPLFHDRFRIVHQRAQGGGRHLSLILEREGNTYDAIFFNRQPLQCSEAWLVYHLRLNRYRDRATLQLEIQAISPI